MHRNIGCTGDGTTFRTEWRRAPRSASQGAGLKLLGCPNLRLQPLQQERDFGCRHRFAEEKSLHLHAAFGAQDFKLLLGLDLLRSGNHAQAGTEPHDGADNGHAVVILAEFVDEGAVNFDFVERKATQIAQ
jgi:hypothetical protein